MMGYTPQKLRAALPRHGDARGQPRQEKEVGRLYTEKVETCDMCALEAKFQGRNSSELEIKHDNLGPVACFTNAVSRTVLASYWRRTHVGLTVLHGTP